MPVLRSLPLPLFLLALIVPRLAAGEARPALSDRLSAPPGRVAKVSLTVRETYDSNVYLQGGTALANQHSLVTGVMPAWSTDWMFSPQAKAAANYQMERTVYHSAASETSTRHIVGLKFTATAGAWSGSVTGGLVSVDGAKAGPTYTGAGGSAAIGGAERMTRRAQLIATGSASVGYSRDRWLLRPLLTWKEQDFRTTQATTAGYQNFVDRGETIAGLDLGWKATPALTVSLGWRKGRQRQAELFGVAHHYTNDLTRWLLGLEGTLASWAKLSLLAGPDRRKFTAAALALNARTKQKFHANATLTLTPTPQDTVTLIYARLYQPAFGGRNIYEDLCAEVQWRRTLTPRWSGSAGHRLHAGNFESGNRRDQIRYSTVTLTYQPDRRSAFTAECQYSDTDTAVPNGADVAGRNYRRTLFGLTYRLNL